MPRSTSTKPRSSILVHRQFLFKRLIIRHKVMKSFLAKSPQALDSHPNLLAALNHALEQAFSATKQWKDLVHSEALRQRFYRDPSPEAEKAKQGKGVGKDLVQADRKMAVVIANILLSLDPTPGVQVLPSLLEKCPDHFLARVNAL